MSTLLTPQQLADRWQCHRDKVHKLLRSGQVRAVNLVLDPNATRPRYAIPMEEIERFEQERLIAKPPPKKPRRKKSTRVRRFYK